MGNRQSINSLSPCGSASSASPPPKSPAICNPPMPPQPFYTDHLSRRLQDWPRRADGRFLACVELREDIRVGCDYIAHARAFSNRWLMQLPHQRLRPPPPPLRLPRALYASQDNAGGARACLNVSEATYVRVSCNYVARAAVCLAAMSGVEQGAGQLCSWAVRIVEYVYGRHCSRVEVR